MSPFQVLARDFPDEVVGFKQWFKSNYGKSVSDSGFIDSSSFRDAPVYFQEGIYKLYLTTRAILISQVDIPVNNHCKVVISVAGNQRQDFTYYKQLSGYGGIVEYSIYVAFRTLYNLTHPSSISFSKGDEKLMTIRGENIQVNFNIDKYKTKEELRAYGDNLGKLIAEDLINRKFGTNDGTESVL